MRTHTCLGVLEPYGFERSIEQSVLSACGHDLDGHTALKEDLLFKVVRLCCLRRNKCSIEGIVLCLIHRAVDI